MAEFFKISKTLIVEDAAGQVSLGGEITRDDAGFDFTYTSEPGATDTSPVRRKPISQEIGPTLELLDVGEAIAAAGIRVCCIKNLSEAQTVTVYSDEGITVEAEIEPGFAAILEPMGAYIPRLKSEYSTVTIRHLAISMPV